MTNSNQKQRFQTKIAMLEQNNQILQNKCEEYLGKLVLTKKQLERTRKALDVAVDALKSAHDYYEYCIQRDEDYGSDDINWDCTAMNMDNDISEAIDKITALEQKDVK